MTGEQLFLRYAFPCADTGAGIIAGQKHRKIDEEHLDRLKQLINSNGQPKHRLLYYCFPRAYRRLKQYAEDNGLERWALATVAEFWRYHHGREDGYEGDCRVRPCAVVEANGNGAMATVECEGEIIYVINIYHLPIQRGQVVYLHWRMIAEIKGMEI
jgi:hypothetical protein